MGRMGQAGHSYQSPKRQRFCPPSQSRSVSPNPQSPSYTSPLRYGGSVSSTVPPSIIPLPLTITTTTTAVGRLLQLVPTHVGEKIINAYPSITSSIPMQGKAHAYMINVGALDNCTDRIDHRINTLTRLMNYSTQTTGLLGSFDDH